MLTLLRDTLIKFVTKNGQDFRAEKTFGIGEQSPRRVAKLGRSQKGYLLKWLSDNGPCSFFGHKEFKLSKTGPSSKGIDILILVL